MPLKRLTCPHCEKPVELQVTSVTRSRECPECHQTIMLQFTTKAQGLKRKALLTKVEEVPDENTAGDDDLPRSLEGDIQKRLAFDPEVIDSARRLRIGFIVVSLFIVLAVAGNYLKWWQAIGDLIGGQTEEVSAADPVILPETLPSQREKGLKKAKLDPNPFGLGENDAAVALKTATQRAMKFLEAENVQDRLNVVRDRSLMEEKIKAYYEKHPAGPIAYDAIMPLGDTSQVMGVYVFDVTLADGAKRKMTVGSVPSGEFYVDWASFVIYGEMSWAEFMKEKPSRPVLFRVLAMKDEFFGGAFAADKSLSCLKLADPLLDESPPIFAYYSRATSMGREMEFVMRQSMGQAIPLILTLSFPENPQTDNQVWVVERVAEGWMARGR